MSQFSQTNNKIRELFNQAHINENDLSLKNNPDLLLTFFKTSIKPFEILQDTGWLNGTPIRTTSQSITKGTKLQEILSIDYNTRVEIPEQFLPFIDILTVVKTPPNAKVDTFTTSPISYYQGDKFRIKVDNTLVWYGPYIHNDSAPNNAFFIPFYTSDQLDTYSLPSTHRKKIWNVVLRWNTGADEWQITGQLLYLDAREDAGTGCDGATSSQWNSFRFRMYTGDDSSEFFAKKETMDKYAIIDNLTTTTATGKAYVDRVRSVSDGGGGCQIDNTTLSMENESVSAPLFQPSVNNIASHYVIQGIKAKKIAGEYVNQSIGTFRESTFPSWNPYFDSVSLAGYVPHYTSDTDGVIAQFFEGVQNIYYLQTGVMPATSIAVPSNYVITVERNPEDNTGTVVERTDFYTRAGTEFVLLGGFNNEFGNSGNYLHSDKVFFLLSQPTGLINSYQLFYKAGISIISPATYNLNQNQKDKGLLSVNPSVLFPAGTAGDRYKCTDTIVAIGGALLNNSGGVFTVNEGDIILCIKNTQAGIDTNWVILYTKTQNDTYKTNAQNFINPGAFWGVDSLHNSPADNKDGRTNDIYLSENSDVQYKLIFVLRNPYFFQETRKYDTTQ